MRRLFVDHLGVRPWVLIALVVAVLVGCVIALLVLPSNSCAQVSYNPSSPAYWSPVNPGNPMNYEPGAVYGPREGC